MIPTFRKSSCGSSITENATYIQNPSYSSTYTVTTTTTCAYSITPVNSSKSNTFNPKDKRHEFNYFRHLSISSGL